MRRRTAALETVPSSATVTKVLRWRRSMTHLCQIGIEIQRINILDGSDPRGASWVQSRGQPAKAATSTQRESSMKRILLVSVSLLGLICTSIATNAQSWPTRPIRAMVGFPAGGIVDVLTRVVCDQLSVQLRQPIIVENRTGAGGAIATAFVAKSDPDGYTILTHSAAHTIAPAIQTISYDP